MKKIVIIGLSLTLAVALVVTVALAWGPGFGRGFGFGPPFANLTKEQSAQIQALQQAYLKEIEPLQQELWTKGSELQKLWSTPNSDPAMVVAKQKEIFDLRTQLQGKANSFRLEVQKLLPANQSFGPGPGFGPPGGFGPGGAGRGFGPGFGPGSFGPGGGFGPGFGAQNQ
jgi:Spy/CpxP family protein refolding chaperone